MIFCIRLKVVMNGILDSVAFLTFDFSICISDFDYVVTFFFSYFVFVTFDTYIINLIVSRDRYISYNSMLTPIKQSINSLRNLIAIILVDLDFNIEISSRGSLSDKFINSIFAVWDLVNDVF